MHNTPPWRALFISDVHLGTRACKADALFDFLSRHHFSKLYLVGDIIDLQQMQSRAHWPQRHNDIVSLIMARAKQGVEVIYIPGNHDAALRQMIGDYFGNIAIQQDAEHHTRGGKRLLVTHGDDFDAAVRYPKLWSFFGDHLNEFLMALNSHFNRLRGYFDLPYWSLSTFIKTHLTKANAYINRFEQAAIAESIKRGFDGVVCGHIHFAALRMQESFCYLNDGDWVESCSAVVEDANGELQLVHHRLPPATRNVVSLPERQVA